MKKAAWFLALQVLLLAACAPKLPSCESVLSSDSYASELDKVFELTNEARANDRYCGDTYYHATTPLSRNEQLNCSASKHAQDMAITKTLSHYTPVGAVNYSPGSGPEDRMMVEGYVGHRYGENIAMGQTSAEAVVLDWLNSPEHCASIMNPDYKDIGLGHATDDEGTDYWVQDFGAP